MERGKTAALSSRNLNLWASQSESSFGSNSNKAVLITQSLQNDLLKPITKFDRIPNLIHVGHLEASRVLGHNEKSGPMLSFLGWAREAASKDLLYIIHIKSWNRPRIQSKLPQHCVKDTSGADLIMGLESNLVKNEIVVNSEGWNDFEGSSIETEIRKIATSLKIHPQEMVIGVIGAQTDMKVQFLVYDLMTRLKAPMVGTCSALTVSSSRIQHFNALSQMGLAWGVEVKESIGEFAKWLAPSLPFKLNFDLCGFDDVITNNPKDLHQSQDHSYKIICEEKLSPEDWQIVHYLFRNSDKVELKPLSGGFSGALVFRALSWDAMKHPQAPTVIKLGPLGPTARERTNFEKVSEILGPHAPNILSFVDLETRGGIKFSYASLTGTRIRNFESVYRKAKNSHELVKVERMLDTVFCEVLGRFWPGVTAARLNLFEHYNFDGKGWAWAQGGSDTPSRVRERIVSILGCSVEQANAPTLTFPGGFEVPNVANFLEDILPKISRDPIEQPVMYVHGDLNGNNILCDDNDNVFLIDFYYTERTHTLKDISKIENDVLYIYTDIENDEQLSQALEISKKLHAVKDLGNELDLNFSEKKDREFSWASFTLEKGWKTVAGLRNIVAKKMPRETAKYGMFIAMLRYELHNLCLPMLSERQRIWSLASACLSAEVLKSDHLKKIGELEIYL